MSGRLPDYIEPMRLVERRAQVRGRLELASLRRLVAACGPQRGTVSASLAFGRDAADRPMLVTRLEAGVTMPCNRCLEPYVQEVCESTSLVLVETEAQAADVEAPYEPLVTGGERVDVAALIEEGLLLALPIVAMHADARCAPHVQRETAPGGGRRRPFAALGALKHGGAGQG